jgi:ABC-type spermidine/putrescine transport system permease subunit I
MAAGNFIGGARLPNALVLAQLSRSDRRVQLALTVPALTVVGIALFIPLGWLLYQSFVGSNGFTFSHYLDVLKHPAYLGYLKATFELAILSTLFSIVLAYPICYAMVTLRRGFAMFLFACVIASFFTSILVRTYAWLLLLQRKGVVNTFLLEHGWISHPLELVYNMQGTVIGMVHILLPLMVLPLYASMKGVDTSLVLAAKGLGASPARAFRDIFLPLSLPGLIAGMILAFVASLGFYVTPAMLGGGRVVVWATAVATAVEQNPEWGAAAALGIILFLLTFSMLLLLKYLFGAKNLLLRGAPDVN